jgi:formylglycine-generating enzyme required for sulfatase activity
VTLLLADLLSGSPARAARAAARLAGSERDAAVRAALRILEEEKSSLEARLGAGTALAVLGDPRLDPLRPALVAVPAGPFRMGMREEEVPAVAREFDIPEEWLRKACPQREVVLGAFEIGRFPVTNGEWAVFAERSGYGELPADWSGRRAPAGRENHPVSGVSFDGALAYCAWLSRETGLRYRLPTEAEWEKAARGQGGRAYPFGDAFDPRCANTREAGIADTTPVGAFPGGASPFGALDLAGNVEEYTGSLYRLYPGSPAEDPDEGSYRVTRGGCFGLDGDLARCDRRHGTPFAGALGFRLARSRASVEAAFGAEEAA